MTTAYAPASTFDKAQRLIRAATGEDYGDGMLVTGIGTGYAEPGYHGSDTVWVLGDWNNARSTYDAQRDGRPLTNAETVPSRLAAALERIGAEIEWSDEWTECQECWRIVRTEPDSYSWRRSYHQTEDGEVYCAECTLRDGESVIAEYVNDAHKCITFAGPEFLTGLGFASYNGTFESGWHPGQNDDPAEILARIERDMPDHDVVFLLNSTGQFDIAFTAWTRERAED